MGANNEPAGEKKEEGLKIFDVWKEYEGVAMHFNELIIQLRVRALAGVAAISAFVGFLSRGDTPEQYRWGILAAALVMLCLVWISIFCLDIFYYDRLLIGSVRAILELEEASKEKSYIKELNLSTRIEETVAGKAGNFKGWKKEPFWNGRMWFYVIVFVALLLGACFSAYHGKLFAKINLVSNFEGRAFFWPAFSAVVKAGCCDV